MNTLLVVDLLGTRSRWQAGGSAAADRAFAAFAQLVADTARNLDTAAELIGDIEADFAAVICPTTESALALGRRIFRRAFLEPRDDLDPRQWLRGAICDGGDDAAVRMRVAMAELPGLRRMQFSPSVMDALAVVRSGFRGMRLLVADAVLNDQLRGMFRIPLGRLGVIPFRRLKHTPYPRGLADDYQDLLWMADTPPEWRQYAMKMKQRVLWSALDLGELEQAAATQVVFHECDSILQSVARKNELQQRSDGGADGYADDDGD